MSVIVRDANQLRILPIGGYSAKVWVALIGVLLAAHPVLSTAEARNPRPIHHERIAFVMLMAI